jgi:tetratricopeptide (TPR) repeat protein
MADLLWFFPDAQFPEPLYEWQRISLAHLYRGKGAPLTFWSFSGPQPLAGGLTALLGEYFRWRGPDYRLLVTRMSETEDGDPSWDSTMLQIAPTNFLPSFVLNSAQLWGELNENGLHITLQNAGQTQQWTLSGSLVQITTDLIALVPQIFARIGLRSSTDWNPPEPLDITDDGILEALLKSWGEINIRYELVNNGLEQYTDALTGALRRLQNASKVGSQFACWAAARAVLPIVADELIPHQAEAESILLDLGSVYPRCAWPCIALTLLNWANDDQQRAAELIESAIEADPRVLSGWQYAAILYSEMYEFDRAEQVCREAITANVADALIYFRLGVLLVDHPADDPNEDENRLREALVMFREAEERGLSDPAVSLRMMDVYEALDEADLMWAAFKQLVEIDHLAITVWQVADDAENYEDFTQGVSILRAAADAKGTYDLRATLTRALIRIDQRDAALTEIERLRSLATDDYEKTETAQLYLEATNPDFEAQFIQIVAELSEGLIPDSTIIDFLHDAIAKEPYFADGAVALAEAYLARDEYEPARLVLDESLKLLPDHIELILEKADLLWAMDQDQGAADLLTETLQRHPEDVAILARLGEYYFEIDEDANAREYLTRAEAYDPRHPELVRVQEYIAERLLADADGPDSEV